MEKTTELQKYLRRRLDAGATLQVVADELGVTRQAILFWLNGERRPSAQLVGKIADHTGIGLRDLVDP